MFFCHKGEKEPLDSALVHKGTSERDTKEYATEHHEFKTASFVISDLNLKEGKACGV